MNKTMVYITTAILLGFGIMMLPLVLEEGQGLCPQFMGVTAERGDLKGNENCLLNFVESAGQPSNLLPFSLISLSGLVAALYVYVIIRKRVI